MLQVRNVTKWFGDNCVLDGVSFSVSLGERVGLVGPNGCGKTTLLDIIAGDLAPDAGCVDFNATNVRPGYLRQGLVYEPGQTVGAAILAAQGPLARLQQRLNELASALAEASGDQQKQLLREYTIAQTDFDAQKGYELIHRMKAVLGGLRMGGVALETPVDDLSGGQKTRLGLAAVLLREPNLLLLDEPTNHLDITGLEWLEGYLQHFYGAVVTVSHDRTLLNRTAEKVLAIDSRTHSLRVFAGNYSAYVQAVQRERERNAQAFHEQQKHIQRVRSELRRVKGRAKRIEQRTIHYHYRKRAKKVARSAVVRERRLQRQLASGDKVEKPSLTWAMKMDLFDTPVSGKTVVVLEELSHRFGGQMLFAHVNLRLQRGERVAVVGANGSGKTTLLRIIAGELTPSVGRARLGASVRVGYYAQEQKGLNQEATPLEEIRSASALSETDARSFLHYFLFTGDDVFIALGELSHGERARLALAKLVLGGCNLLLLDEPINHLDIPSRESFECALSAFEGTVLAVVHDRHFISHYATALWSLEEGTIRRYLDLEEKGRAETAVVA